MRDLPATQLALRGRPQRVVPQPAGEWGEAVTFERHHIRLSDLVKGPQMCRLRRQKMGGSSLLLTPV